MTDRNVPPGEPIERRGRRPGPRRGPVKEQFTLRFTQEEKAHLIEIGEWVQNAVTQLVQASMEGRVLPVLPPSGKKKRPKKRS